MHSTTKFKVVDLELLSNEKLIVTLDYIAHPSNKQAGSNFTADSTATRNKKVSIIFDLATGYWTNLQKESLEKIENIKQLFSQLKITSISKDRYVCRERWVSYCVKLD